MARTQPAFLRLMTSVEDCIDDQHAVAMRDGVIDAEERHVIDQLRFIVRELERGNLARIRSQAIANSWDLDDHPGMARRIRELKADLGDDGPDGGAPMVKAA